MKYHSRHESLSFPRRINLAKYAQNQEVISHKHASYASGTFSYPSIFFLPSQSYHGKLLDISFQSSFDQNEMLTDCLVVIKIPAWM